jgi:PAS domain S-box-containing protein
MIDDELRTDEIENLRQRLEEAVETLRAIRSGEVDALVVRGRAGDEVYTLRTADQPYRALVEQMQEGAVTLTVAGDILYCNRRFADLVATPLQRVIGGSVRRFIAGEDRAAVDALLRAGGGKREGCLQTADGTLINAYLSVSPIIGDEPVLAMVVTDLREQAARRDAERRARGLLDELADRERQEALRVARLNEESLERERRLRQTILDSMADRYYAVDKDWRYTEFNAAAEAQLRALGRDPTTLIGSSVGEEFPSIMIEDVFRRVARAREPATHEHYCTALGEWVEDRVYPGPDGGVTIFQRDVTERRRLEDELRKTAGYVADAEALSHTGTWAWNPTTGRLFWSAEHFKILGLDPASVTPSWDLAMRSIHPEDRPFVEGRFTRAVSERQAYACDCRVVRPDGEIRHIRSLARPVLSVSGDVAEYVGKIIDVTERVRADEALHRSRQELAHVTRAMSLNALTSSIGHDLNQFIVAIMTNASACLRWLSRDSPNLEEASAAMGRIVRDAGLIGDVIGNIRAFLEKTGGVRALVNLKDVIAEVRRLVDPELVRQGVVINEAVADPLPPVLAARVELQQVLLNLMMNAIEAMEVVSNRPRILSIRAERVESERGPAILVAVEDSGAGLGAVEADRLFDPFYTTRPRGLGMGLFIARSIVESHGGRLWAIPNAEHGATFQVTLPIARES